MKQLILVLAIALILVAIPFSNTEARLYPEGYRAYDRDTGEDHPWGGEGDWNEDPIPISSPAKDELSFSTGYSVFDVFVWKFIINVWSIDSTKTDVTVSGDISGETSILNEENGQSETTTSRN